MKEMNREMELSINELEAVSGVVTVCLGVGFSTECVTSLCWGEGHSLDDHEKGYGGNACYLLGAGGGFTF